MPIKVKCVECGGTALVADSAAGKRGKCLRCGGIIEIPGASTPKLCAECGQDVAHAKRWRDGSGSFLCERCWCERERRRRRPRVHVDAIDELGPPVCVPASHVEGQDSHGVELHCELCGGRFPRDLLRTADDGSIACPACHLQNQGDAYQHGAVQRDTEQHATNQPADSGVKTVVLCKRLLVVAVLLHLFPLTWPIGAIMAVWIAKSFCRALSMRTVWPWIIGAAVPAVGVAVLIYLDRRCIVVLTKAGIVPDDIDAFMARKGDPCRSVERVDYRRLLKLNRFGFFLMVLNVVIVFILTGVWDQGVVGVFTLVGIGFKLWTWSKLRPYRRHLRKFYGETSLWPKKPSAIYEMRLMSPDA